MTEQKLPQLEPLGERGTISRAFEEGLLVGAGFRNITSRDSIGDSAQHQGAFEMGLEAGRDAAEKFPAPCDLAREIGYQAGVYDREQELLT